MWVPPRVALELRNSTLQHKAEVDNMVERFAGILAYWTAELKKVDPYLEMIFAPPNANAVGLKPGRYHVMRHNPGAPPSLIPVETESGGFREPDSGVFEMLAKGDLWRDGAMDERRRLKERAEMARQRERELDDELRREEIVERWKAATQTRVSMNRSAPWSQNVAGRRGAKKAA